MAVTPYYDEDGITIYHGDCREILRSLDPESVALVLTDPPYGIGLDTDYSSIPGKSPKGYHHNGGRTYDVVIEDDRPFDPALLLPFGRLILWGANHYATRLPEGGQWIVWRKRGASELMAAAELAWHNCGGRPVDYFETTRNESRQVDGHLHPAQKPTSLMRWLLGKWSEPDDLILDPYMGSGPVLEACRDLGRRYIGIEIEERYCEIAVQRLAQGVLEFDR
jgi:hypothetical protein